MRFLALFCLPVLIVGCSTPSEYIKSGVSEKVNYAYATTDVLTTKNCLKSKWATRDIHGWVQTYQMTPLVEIPMGDFDRLSWQNLILMDVYRSGDMTVIRESHQIDIPPIWKGVTKDVLMKCSTRQEFTNLRDVNENTLSK